MLRSPITRKHPPAPTPVSVDAANIQKYYRAADQENTDGAAFIPKNNLPGRLDRFKEKIRAMPSNILLPNGRFVEPITDKKYMALKAGLVESLMEPRANNQLARNAQRNGEQRNDAQAVNVVAVGGRRKRSTRKRSTRKHRSTRRR